MSVSATIQFDPNGNGTATTPMFSSLSPFVNASTGLIGGFVALVAAILFVNAVRAENEGNAKMRELRLAIYDGARAYLLTQYKWLSLWCVAMFLLILLIIGVPSNNIADGVYTAICFVIGSAASALSGYVGMLIATQANSRTCEACRQSISRGLQVSFASGAVMGNVVVGLALVGISVLYLLFTYLSTDSNKAVQGASHAPGGGYNSYVVDYTWDAFSGVFNRLAGFGFGASTIGMFARVGGGVFTKAADVGSDLVGKVEQGIPEDDPRNPAVIADNVGDNVGDVAGMGADLFESYAGAVIATATLAPRFAADNVDIGLNLTEIDKDFNNIMNAAVALPLWIDGFGIVASLVGIAYVRNAKLADDTPLDTLLGVIMNGVVIATVLTMAASAFCVFTLFRTIIAAQLFGSIAIGLVAGVIISKFTEYCTAYEYAPTREISQASEYGPAPVIIKGLGVGMMSVSVPAFTIAIAIVATNALSGQYGVAIAAVGLLSTLGITLATDAYGPVADNAGGIAEMAHLEPEVRSRTDKLDALGNTTAATGKGLAIASATLTAVGLIAAFVEQAGLVRVQGAAYIDPANYSQVVDLSDSIVLTGVLLGACLPYIFAALTMLSVDRGARAIITEVRLQFATAPLLMRGAETQIVDGHKYPDSTRCVQIATEAAIQEMVMPGVLAVFVPIIIGFLLGPKGTCGLLAGALGGCFMLALTMATTGGAWDNSKKWNEKCASEGEPTGRKLANGNEELTFTNFGIKLKGEAENFDAFKEMLTKYGKDAFIIPELRSTYNGPADTERLFYELAKKYHDRHAATVTGDTVGDPFKDTSGPALNVLIKTMTMMALMLAPAYHKFAEWDGFQVKGSSIAVGLAVIVGLATYLLVSYFRRINKTKNDEAIAKKKEADKKYLAAGGAVATFEESSAAPGGLSDAATASLLRA